jgi:hypothetical protein
MHRRTASVNKAIAFESGDDDEESEEEEEDELFDIRQENPLPRNHADPLVKNFLPKSMLPTVVPWIFNPLLVLHCPFSTPRASDLGR